MPSTNGHGSSEATEQIALYLRVSSQEQRERETIEIQREFLEQYCQLYGLEVADIYEDDGISGTIPLHERPDGRRLLEDAKQEKFEAVLVSKLDRLGRTLLVIVDAHDGLQEGGVALRSGREPIDTSTPLGRLIFQMFASFAEYDRESIRERTQAGQRRAFKNGRQMGSIPYGYDIAADAASGRGRPEHRSPGSRSPPRAERGCLSASRWILLPGQRERSGRKSRRYRFRRRRRRRDTARILRASARGFAHSYPEPRGRQRR